MTESRLIDRINNLRAQGRFAEVTGLLPYAEFVGLETLLEDGQLFTRLNRRPSNIGNTQLPAVHGGVVGALMEHAAVMHLLWELELARLPRIINISIDYLRPCLDRETLASGRIIKQGRRIANVRVEAWQQDQAKPVSAAHVHFLTG